METQNYVEKVFPFTGARLISINDFYDSAENNINGTETEVKFKNLINGIYPQMCSKNIKQALRKRAETGKYQGTIPIYGYRFADGDNSALEIDAAAALVVQKIFSMRLGGESINGIARLLNAKGIPCPAEYLKEYGNLPKKKGVSVWTSYSVKHILGNIAYTGVIENHKTETVIASQKTTICVPKAERILVPDMHEAIISQEDFETVNKIEKNDGIRKAQNRGRRQKSSIFTGKLKCGFCKKAMIFRSYETKHQLCVKFFCRTVRVVPDGKCYTKNIRVDELEAVILQLVRQQAALADANINMIDEMSNTTMESKCKKEIEAHERQLAVCKNKQFEIYEAFASGSMKKEVYLAQKESLQKKEKDCREAIGMLENQISQLIKQKEQYRKLAGVAKYAGIETLSDQIVDELIETIYFYNPENIEVIWRFTDEMIGSIMELEINNERAKIN